VEGLANHQGSAFGGLGQAPQPTNEQFENELIAAALSIPRDDQPIWVEDESRGIGKVYLPAGFYAAMQQAPLYQLELPQAVRVQRLVADYGRHPVAVLQTTFEQIRKRMGGQFVKAAQEALAAGDVAEAARLALTYYDRAYAHGLKKRNRPPLQVISANSFDAQVLAVRLQKC
jgi:tRNA 2-selenouridine synthase